MISRRAVMQAALFSLALPSTAAFAVSDVELSSRLDRDHDGTVDLGEAQEAASRLFDSLDRDHDGTLTRHELSGRLSLRELATADPDHDKTLSKEEYLALVEQRFKAADPDNDGTVSAAELRSKAGRGLLRLLK